MAIIDVGELGVSRKLWCSKRNKDHVQHNFDPAIDSNDNVGHDGGFDEEVEESLEKVTTNFKKNQGQNTKFTKSLENSDGALKIQLEMFEFKDLMNQKLKHGKTWRINKTKLLNTSWCKVLGLFLTNLFLPVINYLELDDHQTL